LEGDRTEWGSKFLQNPVYNQKMNRSFALVVLKKNIHENENDFACWKRHLCEPRIAANTISGWSVKKRVAKIFSLDFKGWFTSLNRMDLRK
jgi:hypothetical protein